MLGVRLGATKAGEPVRLGTDFPALCRLTWSLRRCSGVRAVFYSSPRSNCRSLLPLRKLCTWAVITFSPSTRTSGEIR